MRCCSVQGVRLVVSAYEVVKCRKRIALPESLKDGGNLPTRLPVGDWHAFHDFGGHEAQADRHDGLRVRQQREGLRIVHVGTNEEIDMIAESMDLLWGQTSTLETHGLRVEENGGDGSERIAGGVDHRDRHVAREGLEGVNVCGWGAAGASVARCGIHWAGTAQTRRHGDDDALQTTRRHDEESRTARGR